MSMENLSDTTSQKTLLPPLTKISCSSNISSRTGEHFCIFDYHCQRNYCEHYKTGAYNSRRLIALGHEGLAPTVQSWEDIMRTNPPRILLEMIMA
jgi:hypothetical protein